VIVADVGGRSFHVGDEAMLAANLAALRRQDPGLQVSVVGRATAATEDGERLSEAEAETLAKAGGLFLSGAGNLSSSWPGLLRQRLLWMREARRRRLPVVTGGQTIGPELTPRECAALAEALTAVDHLGVREMASAALALRMGVAPERLSYQVDDAFFLAGRPPAAAEAVALPDGPFVAVTLDPAFGAASSRASLGSLAAQLAWFAAESGLRLAFLPHVGTLGSLGEEDGQAGAALAELLRAKRTACTLFPVLPPAPAIWLTQQAALVVSSRYHPLVFGTAAGVPCLGIYRDAYTRIKLQGALVHVGMEDWCLSEAAVAEGGALETLRRLWSGREGLRATMTRARAPLALQEARRWRQLAARLGWPAEAGEGPESPGRTDRMAAAAFTTLALERQAGDAETRRWRAIVKHYDRSVDLAVRALPKGRRNRMETTLMLTEQQWNDYARDGFLPLGRVLETEELEGLRQRADDLALGNVKNPDVQMQLDTGGAYEDLPAAIRGFDHGTMLYRKIQGLETDDRFSRLVKHPLFLEVCARQYGRHTPISIFRAMVMNKPAGQGTVLPWHQDGGHVWALDRDPLVTIWVALDPATRANGCLEVIPGSHLLGLLSLYGSTVAAEDVARHCPEDRVLPLEVEAGHAVLLHNWLIHRSGVNPTPAPRRAFTTCYMDGRTQSTLTGHHFPIVAGSLPPEPYPFIHLLREENRALREMREEAERYAKSLEAAAQPPQRGVLPSLKQWLRGS
jgi:polysaccharide pyruvyl transferase WcaK-like protein